MLAALAVNYFSLLVCKMHTCVKSSTWMHDWMTGTVASRAEAGTCIVHHVRNAKVVATIQLNLKHTWDLGATMKKQKSSSCQDRTDGLKINSLALCQLS
jgi:hypothetical protein